MTKTKKDLIIEVYSEFKNQTKKCIQDCEIFPNIHNLDLYDFLFHFSLLFENEQYYKESIDYIINTFDIKLTNEQYNEVYPIIIEFIEKLKSIT